MTTIKDRTGRTIPQNLVDKATRIARDGVRVEVPGSLYQVEGDTDTYLVAITSVGEAACRCRWGRETDALCSHIIAVHLYAWSRGEPVHIAKIDGPKQELRAVPDDPFEGL